MAAFTVRVELHDNPTWNDYEKLHKAMEGEGFSRTIKDGQGMVYHLPTAEYNFIGALSRDQIYEKAKHAAAKAGKKYSLLVTESNGRTWQNLEPVKST
jgi:hypothetical protein